MVSRSLASSMLLAATLAGPAGGDSRALSIETVAEGVFAFRPTAESVDTWRAVSNSGAVLLDGGVLIYDSHWTPELAGEAIALLRGHTDLPIRWVVSSHFHGDHTGGYWAYGRDVEIVSHRATRELLVEETETLDKRLPLAIAQYESQLAQLEDAAQRARIGNSLRYSRELLERLRSGRAQPLPTVSFDSMVTLHRGRAVEVYFLGRGHTAGDAILFLPELGVAFLGDLLFNRTLPNVNDGFTGDWIETLEAVLELGASRFVPGHGAIGGVEAVHEQIAYLRWLRDAVRPFVDEERGVDAAVEGIALPEEFADFEFPFFLANNVRKVYAELGAER